MKKTVILASLCWCVLCYSQYLKCPLEDGKIINTSADEYGVNNMQTTIEGNKSGIVRSFLSGKVFKVLKDEHSESFIVIVKNGDNYISFNNLATVNIKEGDELHIGNIVGDVKIIDAKFKLTLMKFIGRELVRQPFRSNLKCRE